MRRRWGAGLLSAIAALSIIASAQETKDVSVTLRTQNGRTQFRIGEVIPVELSFQSNVPDHYLVWTVPSREIIGDEYDWFHSEPTEGTTAIPPLRQNAYNGPSFRPEPLDPTPIPLTLNDWIAIHKTGRYRITIETTRAAGLMVVSNPIEIDMVAPEPGWGEAQVKHASEVLNRVTPQWSPASAYDAARALRFLGTLDAAHAMVRLTLDGLLGFQYEILQGLRESPFRQEVIAELEAEIATRTPQVSPALGNILSLLKADAGR